MTLHWLQERRRRKAAADLEELAAELAWIQEVVDYIDREATNPVHIVREQHVVPDADDGLRVFGATGPGWLTRRREPVRPLPEPEASIDEPCDDPPRAFTGPDVADLIGKIARESTPCRPHGAHWASHLDGDASADPDGTVPPAPPWLEGPDDAGAEAEGGASVILDGYARAAAPGEPAASGRSTASLAPVGSCRRPASSPRVCRTRQPDSSPEDPVAALWALPATSPRRSF